MTPIKALPTPSLKPVRINGNVEGRTTLLNICHSEAPKLFAAVSRLYGVVFTPARALIRIGKTAPRKMMPTFESMPIPSQIMTKGKRATRGVAFMALMKGSKMYAIFLYQPQAIPKGTPTITESTYPQANSMPLTRRSFQISPDVNSCTAAFQMREGALMNMGLINCNVLPINSQAVRNITTAVVPRIFFSLLR